MTLLHCHFLFPSENDPAPTMCNGVQISQRFTRMTFFNFPVHQITADFQHVHLPAMVRYMLLVLEIARLRVQGEVIYFTDENRYNPACDHYLERPVDRQHKA